MALGLAPGELSLIRATADLAPGNASSAGGTEGKRSPVLPVELNGVSVAVNGAAAGLYSVGNSPSQINFVVPIGLVASATPANVVVNNHGTVFRGSFQIVTAQPDIFTTTMDAGGRASVCNITNMMAFPCITEPFKVMSADQTGTLAPTRLLMNLTGVRNIITASDVKITFVATTSVDIMGSAIRPNLNMPGWDEVEFILPSDLMPGDYPIVVTVTTGGASFRSRPAETAPHITIIP